MYVSVERIQAWLQDSKFDVGEVEETWENLHRLVLFGKLERRYDTTLWTDEDDTPELVLNIMSMKVAADFLRKVASEEDGLTTYADHLDQRAMMICDGIVAGDIDIVGTSEDTDTVLGAGVSHWPDNTSTTLYLENKNADGSTSQDGAAVLAFEMGLEF